MRRCARIAVAAVSVGLGALLAGSLAFYAFPMEDEPHRADAIVILGGLDGKPVLAEARRLLDAGYSDRVVISDAFGGNTWPQHLCSKFADTYECFEPDPVTTQGEARAIGQLADERGWEDVVVVTNAYHVNRARMLVSRCYGDGLAVIGADAPLSTGDWLYQYFYQTAALAKALTSPAC